MKNIDENETFDILDDVPCSFVFPIYLSGALVMNMGIYCPLASVAIIAKEKCVSLYFAYTLIENSFQSFRKIFVWIWVFCTCFSVLRNFRVHTKFERIKVFYIHIVLLLIGLMILIWYFIFPAVIKVLSAFWN